jgi:hypothetical protein
LVSDTGVSLVAIAGVRGDFMLLILSSNSDAGLCLEEVDLDHYLLGDVSPRVGRSIKQQHTTAPAKPSLQTQYVLDAMGDSAAETTAAIDKLQKSLDLLHGVVAGVDTTQ